MTNRPIARQGVTDLVDSEILRALRNDVADFGLWPVRFDIPAGWHHTGFIGDFRACVAYVRALDGVTEAGASEEAPGELASRIAAALHRWRPAAVLSDGAGLTSYADLDAGRTTVARRLRELGIAAGEPVAVPAAPARAHLAALTGVVCHGALPVSGQAVAVVDDALVVTRSPGGAVASGPRPVGVLAGEWGDLLLDDASACAQLDRTVAGQLRPTDRVALLGRSGGWRHAFELWSAVTHGACLVAADGGDAGGDRDGAALPEGRVTVLVAAPAVVRRARDLTALRLVVSDGPLDEPTRLLLGGRGIDVVEVQAHAAASGIVAERNAGQTLWRPVLPGTTYVLGPDMAAVAPGEQGRLFVGGPTVARLRERRPVVALRHFLPDPFAADGSRMVAVGAAVSARRTHDNGTTAFHACTSTPEPTTEERT